MINKRGRETLLYNSAIFQILLLVGMSFSIAFIFSEYVGLGSAQTGNPIVDGHPFFQFNKNSPVGSLNPTGGLKWGSPEWNAKYGAGLQGGDPLKETVKLFGGADKSTLTRSSWVDGKLVSKADGNLFVNDETGAIFDNAGTQVGSNPASAGSRGIGQFIKDIYGGKAFSGAAGGGVAGIGSSLISGAAWGFKTYD